MSPIVLGIDTSGAWCSAAVSRTGDGTAAAIVARRAEVGNAHSGHVLSMVDAVLTEAGLSLSDCDAVAFAAGPGSFTGLRVACAVAQGLAYGASVPVAAVGTLDAIAHAATRDAPTARSVLVLQDARMGEVYWTLLDATAGRLEAVEGPALATPMQMRDRLRTGRAECSIDLGCGNAWTLHDDALDGLVRAVAAPRAADAVDVVALGIEAVRAGRLVSADRASPLYVRDDVARTTAQREASRAAALAG